MVLLRRCATGGGALRFQKLMCDGLYMFGPGSGTIRRCGPVGVGVDLLELVCH